MSAAPSQNNALQAEVRQSVADSRARHAASRHVLDAARAADRLARPDSAIAEAHARYRLGLQLLRQGHADEAQALMAEATRLHPDSWAMWRQAAAKDARGLAAGPAFWARVDALGSRPYYAPVEMAAADAAVAPHAAAAGGTAPPS